MESSDPNRNVYNVAFNFYNNLMMCKWFMQQYFSAWQWDNQDRWTATGCGEVTERMVRLFEYSWWKDESVDYGRDSYLLSTLF